MIRAAYRRLISQNVNVAQRCYISTSQIRLNKEVDEEPPPIPMPKERPGEDIVMKKARLLYQSRKRGMLENGLILSTFASKYLESLTEPQLKMYDNLINLPSNDWDIYNWAIGKDQAPAEFDNEILDMLKEHTKNKEGEERFAQPELHQAE